MYTACVGTIKHVHCSEADIKQGPKPNYDSFPTASDARRHFVVVHISSVLQEFCKPNVLTFSTNSYEYSTMTRFNNHAMSGGL